MPAAAGGHACGLTAGLSGSWLPGSGWFVTWSCTSPLWVSLFSFVSGAFVLLEVCMLGAHAAVCVAWPLHEASCHLRLHSQTLVRLQPPSCCHPAAATQLLPPS